MKKESLEERKQILASEWHPTKNDPLSFQEAFCEARRKKAWWLGACGHEWETSLFHRMQGTRCPYCQNQRLLVGFNDLATTHPELANEWHPTLNGELTPSDVSKGMQRTVWWLGACGHEWEAKIGNRAKGSKCPYCAKKRKIENKTYVSKPRKQRRSQLSETNNLTTTHPTLAQYWHPTKNGELMPQQVLKSFRTKVWWQCPHGHEWEMAINSAVRRFNLNGIECLYCHRANQTN